VGSEVEVGELKYDEDDEAFNSDSSVSLLLQVLAMNGRPDPYCVLVHLMPTITFVEDADSFSNQTRQSEKRRNSRMRPSLRGSIMISGPRRSKVRPGEMKRRLGGSPVVLRCRASNARVWACVWREVFNERVTRTARSVEHVSEE
jgi:hypothetical protein